MKRPEPKYEKISVPRIHSDIKEMNGKSTHRLQKCIEELDNLLDENNKVQHEESDSLRDTGTE